jgi:hypothetical protein
VILHLSCDDFLSALRLRDIADARRHRFLVAFNAKSIRTIKKPEREAGGSRETRASDRQPRVCVIAAAWPRGAKDERCDQTIRPQAFPPVATLEFG